MPRPKGTNSYWDKVKKIQDFEEKYITKVLTNINKALKIQIENLDGENPNLKTGASNFFIQEYKRLFKEFKGKTSVDFADKSICTNKKKKIKGAKDNGNGYFL
jgi:hypothetical protein